VLSQAKIPNCGLFTRSTLPAFGPLKRLISQPDDTKHLPNLPPDQLHFLSVVLGFFAISNKIVADNLSKNFMTKVISLEAQFCYGLLSTHDGKHPQ
jgi:ribonucleotide reductase beta subunit family protein with ferritin-like domain